MAKMHTGALVKKAQLKEQAISTPTIVYVDKIIEKEVEKLVHVDRPVEVIKYEDRIVEVAVNVQNIEKIREIQMKYDKLVKKNLYLTYAAFIAVTLALVAWGK